MMWSKLINKFKGFINPESRGIIDVFCTSYHDARDDYGEAWITVDGEKVFGGGYYHWYMNPIPHADSQEFRITHGFHPDYYRAHIESEEVKENMDSGIQETSHITRNNGELED